MRDEPCQECRENRQRDAQLRAEYVRKMGGAKLWDDFTERSYVRTKYNEQAFTGAKAWDHRAGSIMFTGPRGTGKSHLAAVVKRPLILTGKDVLTIHMADLLAEVQGKISSGTYAKHLEAHVLRMRGAGILSLEDLGVEKPSEAVSAFYFRVVDGRYRDNKGGMIVTTNFSLDELEQRWSFVDPYGRVISRLKEMCRGRIYSLAGEKDWRA